MFDWLRNYFAGGVCHCSGRLDGKTAIITGANTGLGRATARILAAKGAKLILGCRDDQRGETAARELRETTGNPEIQHRRIDLASMESIREFASNILKSETRLDLLINNAGVMMVPRLETVDGFELHLGVNHLGHFLLTNLLLNLMKSTRSDCRVINVASMAQGHCLYGLQLNDIHLVNSYNKFEAYSRSKLANVLFTLELSERLKGTNVSTFAVHPGAVKTELGRHIAGYSVLGMPVLGWPLRAVMKTPEQGAQTSVHCALASGLVSGFITVTVTNPIWMVKTRLQLDDSFRNSRLASLHCVRDIVRFEGPRSLFRGISASYLGISETVIHFFIYEKIKRSILTRDDEDSIKQTRTGTDFAMFMLAAMCSKNIASFCTYPHEVLRTRLRQRDCTYRHVFHGLACMARTEGRAGMYSGLAAHITRQTPNIAITMAVYELVAYMFDN